MASYRSIYGQRLGMGDTGELVVDGNRVDFAAIATSDKAEIAALAAMTVTATSGSLPTANGSLTIANAASPTVAELQEFCVELKAKVDAIIAALKA